MDTLSGGVEGSTQPLPASAGVAHVSEVADDDTEKAQGIPPSAQSTFPAPVLAEPQQADSLTQKREQDDGGEARESTATEPPKMRNSRGGENTLEQPQTEGSPWREWTPEYIKRLLGLSWDSEWWSKICDAHNAALAAATKIKWSLDEKIARDASIRSLQQQLAVKQERVKDCANQIDNLQEELDSERKDRKIIERSRDAWRVQVVELGKALATERENRDALTKQIAIGLKRENKLSEELAAERDLVE